MGLFVAFVTECIVATIIGIAEAEDGTDPIDTKTFQLLKSLTR